MAKVLAIVANSQVEPWVARLAKGRVKEVPISAVKDDLSRYLPEAKERPDYARGFWRVLTTALFASLCAEAAGSGATNTTAYVNGRWFDGVHFSERTAYVVGDTLSFHRPKNVYAIVDLRGGYVVPPFAEAHKHNVEPRNNIPKLIATYLEPHSHAATASLASLRRT
jgi:hypothetical protein